LFDDIVSTVKLVYETGAQVKIWSEFEGNFDNVNAPAEKIDGAVKNEHYFNYSSNYVILVTFIH